MGSRGFREGRARHPTTIGPLESVGCSQLPRFMLTCAITMTSYRVGKSTAPTSGNRRTMATPGRTRLAIWSQSRWAQASGTRPTFTLPLLAKVSWSNETLSRSSQTYPKKREKKGCLIYFINCSSQVIRTGLQRNVEVISTTKPLRHS